MNSSRRTSIAAGVLLILATAASIAGSVFLQALHVSDDLTVLASDFNHLAASALWSLVAAGASVGIAIAFYPLLKPTNGTLAVGSVVFRTIEAVMYSAEVVCLLTLGALAQRAGAVSTVDPGQARVIADTLLSAREHFALVAVFAFTVGSVMYYLAFFQSRLIPRWLSGWGLAAAPPMLIACLLALFNDHPVNGYVLLFLPIAVQEIVLAVWLLTRGFRPSPPLPARPVSSPDANLATTDWGGGHVVEGA